MLITGLAGGIACTPVAAQGSQSPATNPPAHMDQQEIMLQVHDLLEERASSWPGQAIITVHPPKNSLEPCGQLEIHIAGSGALRPKTPVAVRCLEPQPWSTYIQAGVQIIGQYFVAARVIQRGDVISQTDINTREGDLLRNRRAISDPALIMGWVATRRIPAGSTIDANALRDPNSVTRGQQVRTIARGVGFVATGEGQALESGGPGSQIQVRSSSGQIITATVIDAHTVQVMM